jgi:hypothetical protein
MREASVKKGMQINFASANLGKLRSYDVDGENPDTHKDIAVITVGEPYPGNPEFFSFITVQTAGGVEKIRVISKQYLIGLSTKYSRGFK